MFRDLYAIARHTPLNLIITPAGDKKSALTLPGAAPKPAAKPAVKPAPAAAGDDTHHMPNLPGKPECIKDYQQMKLRHGDKLTRRLFIKKGETGRRYEKLWKNWEQFLKAASAQAELPLDDVHEETDADRLLKQESGPAAST